MGLRLLPSTMSIMTYSRAVYTSGFITHSKFGQCRVKTSAMPSPLRISFQYLVSMRFHQQVSCPRIVIQGDIKKDQMKMYKKKKKDLDSKVAVVFNKVDLLFSNSEEDKFDADYFKIHRVRTADKLGCNSEDVHYVCLDPRNKQTLTELQKLGVLDFEGLAKKIGGWLAMHSASGSHHILME